MVCTTSGSAHAAITLLVSRPKVKAASASAPRNRAGATPTSASKSSGVTIKRSAGLQASHRFTKASRSSFSRAISFKSRISPSHRPFEPPPLLPGVWSCRSTRPSGESGMMNELLRGAGSDTLRLAVVRRLALAGRSESGTNLHFLLHSGWPPLSVVEARFWHQWQRVIHTGCGRPPPFGSRGTFPLFGPNGCVGCEDCVEPRLIVGSHAGVRNVFEVLDLLAEPSKVG